MTRKKNILFVGSFNSNTKDGSSGGQLFACTSLIESDLKDRYNFITIDTTAETVPAPPIYKRIPKVLSRLIKFLYAVMFKNIDSVLIFSSAKFSFLEKGTMVIIARTMSKRVVFAPRSGLIMGDYEKSRFMGRFIPFVIRSSTYLLCQGTRWKLFYQKISNEPDEKFIIVNNWIDVVPYLQTRSPKSNNPLKIIYLGWLEEYKGIKDFLAALKILSEKGFIFECDIYGNGSLYDYANSFISINGLNDIVSLKGWADKQIKMKSFKSADVYILPSHYEGFPNALLEAMASELAVVATKIVSIDDILTHRKNGLIAECNNPESLAYQIEVLLTDTDLRSKVALNARKTVLEKFTIQTAVEKFEKIL